VGKARPVFLTLGAPFLKGEGTLEQAVKDKEYPEYLTYCDVAGCAVYPVTAGHAGGRPDAVAKGLAELRKMAGPDKPVFAWIEAAPKVGNVIRNAQDIRASREPKSAKDANDARKAPLPPPTAIQTRAEAWMAVIGGATAIGYRGFEGFADVKLEAGMEADLKRLNDQISRLAPAVLADPAKAKIEMSIAGELPCHFKATELDGAIYLFAQSIDAGSGGEPRKAKATIKVAGLKAGTKVEAVDENRTITAEDGQFTDEFAPLAEHVYKIKS